VYSQGVKVTPPRTVLQALADRVGAQAIYIKYRPVQGNVLDERTKRSLTPIEPLIGKTVERVDVIENGLRYIIRPAEGLNPGLFLDMREVREFVREMAAGKTVLNCFAYTCAFGVAALQGGAARVLNLDVSRHYLDWGRENAELNGYAAVPTDFVKGDVFDWLKRFGKRGQKFDVVILDPPAFAKRKKDAPQALAAYRKLNQLALPLIDRDGIMVSCSCSYHMAADDLEAAIQSAARHSSRFVQVLELGGQSPDHPVHPAIPETRYLKSFFCRVTRE
jgi:23S rRNA (cytosine1962-C5)-methyltransferase